MLDIQGMINAIKGRDAVIKRLADTETKKRDEQEELDKLTVGKTTLKSFFKSKEGKENDIKLLTKSINTCNFLIEEYRKLINFITVYQGHYAIERFKKDKIKQYERMLYLMSVRSISNSHMFANLAN